MPPRKPKGSPSTAAGRKKNPRQGFPKGSNHPSAALNLQQVKALRAGKYDHRPYAALAEEWGVSAAAISLARTGKTWAWVPGAKKPLKPTDPRRYRSRTQKKR